MTKGTSDPRKELLYYELEACNSRLEKISHRVRVLRRQVSRKKKYRSPKRVSLEHLKTELVAEEDALEAERNKKNDLLNKLEKL